MLSLPRQAPDLNEDQIMQLKAAFKAEQLPSWRYYSLVGYNMGVAGLLLLYGRSYRKTV